MYFKFSMQKKIKHKIDVKDNYFHILYIKQSKKLIKILFWCLVHNVLC